MRRLTAVNAVTGLNANHLDRLKGDCGFLLVHLLKSFDPYQTVVVTYKYLVCSHPNPF